MAKKLTLIALKIDDDLLEFVDKYAKSKDWSRSQTARNLLKEKRKEIEEKGILVD